MSATTPHPLKGLSVAEAGARMLSRVAPLPIETVTLADADNRVLAEPVTAVRDQPPFDASAMDGWAARAVDLDRSLRIAGESAAGAGYDAALQPGEAVRIFTGAPVPVGADIVVMQEEAVRDGQGVTLSPGKPAATHIRPRGGDFHVGQVLLAAGLRLDPWRLSLAASAGRASLPVHGRPRVVILATGEELAAPGTQPGPWQIFESGSQGLVPMIQRWGGLAERLTPAGDDADAIAAAIAPLEADLIVTVGGASVGDHDLVKPALTRLGLQLDVETINVRPGKPTWFGRLADGRLVIGLPGNPASAFVCAELFLRPLVLALQGATTPRRTERLPLAAPLPANGPRAHYMRAAVIDDGVLPFADQDSSLVTVFASADVLLQRAPNAPAAAVGAWVDVLRLDRG